LGVGRFDNFEKLTSMCIIAINGSALIARRLEYFNSYTPEVDDDSAEEVGVEELDTFWTVGINLPEIISKVL